MKDMAIEKNKTGATVLKHTVVGRLYEYRMTN